MLTIEINSEELFDEETSTFITSKKYTLQLEHSLISISKWESKWRKSFINSEKTEEESLDYIKCMTIDRDIPDYIYRAITNDQIREITEYISNPMTATTINVRENGKKIHKIITSEVVYYWMITLNIPIEFQKWHFNRLMTLIQVCSIENAPKKNMSKSEILGQNKSLNAKRRAMMGTHG